MSQHDVLTQKQIQDSVREAVKDAYGDLGLAKLQPNCLIKYYNPSTRVFILRVAREDLHTAETSLTLMTRVSGLPETLVARVRILHVGGTLEKVEKAMKKMTQAWIEGHAKKEELKLSQLS